MGRHYTPKWSGEQLFTLYARDVPRLLDSLESRFNGELKEFVVANWQQVPETGKAKSHILRISANAKTE